MNQERLKTTRYRLNKQVWRPWVSCTYMVSVTDIATCYPTCHFQLIGLNFARLLSSDKGAKVALKLEFGVKML